MKTEEDHIRAQMTEKNFCELCGEAGLSSRLVPCQINTEEAIFVCENTECVFPLGSPRVGSFVVCRKAAEISNTKRKRKKTLEQNNSESSASLPISVQEQFINWQNADALCWLDCALSLLVHNHTLKNLHSTIQSPNSLLRSLLDDYEKAQQLGLSDLPSAKKVLDDIRNNVWEYLAPKMKCELGVNDSPLFALLLLLREDVFTLEKCLQEYTWYLSCRACGYEEKTKRKGSIVTFPNTPNDFEVQMGSFLRTCPKCNSVQQKSTLMHERMPDLVIMHFVEGLNSDGYLDSMFTFNDNIYQLTQFIQYSRNPDHFVCWTKENDGSRWLELDDLKPPICSLSDSPPKVLPREVHIVVFEKITSKLCDNKISLAAEKLGDMNVHDDGNLSQIDPILPSLRNKEILGSEHENCTSQKIKGSISCEDMTEIFENTSDDTDCSSSAITAEVSDNESVAMLAHGSSLKSTFTHQDMERQNGQTNQNSKAVVSELQHELVLNECSSTEEGIGSHDNDNDKLPLQDCSNKLDNPIHLERTGNTAQSTLLAQTPLKSLNKLGKTPSVIHEGNPSMSSLLNSHSLENSLMKVTLKRHSCSKKFQPLLHNKRRTLSSQFQPYVPKRQRLDSQNDQKTSFDFDHQSDSGYSSPSSVSSCGSASSTSSIDNEQKIHGTDDIEKMEVEDNHDNIAEELEKLLPDCLLNTHSKRTSIDDQFTNSRTTELETISMEQDDFIRNILFSDS